MCQRRVAITGLGAVTSLGLDVPTLWANIVEGRSGVAPTEAFDSKDHTSKIASEVRNFDPSQWMERRDAKRLDRFAQFALAAAVEAVADSGIDFQREDRDRVGVIVGTGIGGLIEMEQQMLRMLDGGPRRVSPFLIPKLMANAAAGVVSIRWELAGPNSCSVTACSSATHSLGDALRCIQRGEADMVLSGGAEAAITPLGMAGFCSMSALSTRNDDPTAASRPFDKDRDGFVMGEGAGVVLLEEVEHARARGAKIYAELVGFGATGDGYHITAPQPDGQGAAKAMSRAMEDAGVSPDQVDYINAHGTSTLLNDAMETKAIHKALGAAADSVAVSSTKSMLGHLLGATGGVELILAALAVHNDIAPPTINYHTPDPDCDLFYVPNESKRMTITHAMSNTLGFGGHNASLVLRKADFAG